MDRDEFTRRILAMRLTLYRVSYGILASESEREDAVQNAVMKAWQKHGQLRDERLLETWLVRILINECYKIRRKSGFVISFEDYTADIPSDVKIDNELRDAVFRLPIKLRSVIVLYYIEGYSVEETAYMLKLPQGTVKSRLHKARKLLKTMLDDEI